MRKKRLTWFVISIVLLSSFASAVLAGKPSSRPRIEVSPSARSSVSISTRRHHRTLVLKPRIAVRVPRTTTTTSSIPPKSPPTTVMHIRISTAITAPQGGENATSGCQYASLIRSIWQQDADWAIWVVSKRGGHGESNCTAGARNASGSSGLFQLMMPLHSDLLRAVCPGRDPMQSVFDPECNIRAAWRLYQGSGRSPWHL